MARLRATAARIVHERTQAADVTDAYVDLAARIENLRRAETELHALLTHARTSRGKLEDILAVQRELTATREQIELYQGRLNVLSDQVALATIDVTLLPPQAVVDPTWSPTRTLAAATHTLTTSLQWLASAAIVAVVVGAPWTLLLAVATWAAWRIATAVRRRMGDTAASA